MYFRSATARTLGDIAPAGGAGSYVPPPIFQVADLPDGRGAAVQTLRYMRDFVHDAIKDPSQTVRGKALSLVAQLPPRKWFPEIYALHQFVRDDIRYIRDPDGYELVQSPDKTLELGQGDCDDKSTLLAALLKVTGHPARFVALGFNGDPLSHVLVETKVDSTGNDQKDWMPLETIIPKPAGWYPPGVTSRYVLKV